MKVSPLSNEKVGFVPFLFKICAMNFPAVSVLSFAVTGIFKYLHKAKKGFFCFCGWFWWRTEGRRRRRRKRR